jgi:hypothetical protein
LGANVAVNPGSKEGQVLNQDRLTIKASEAIQAAADVGVLWARESM